MRAASVSQLAVGLLYAVLASGEEAYPQFEEEQLRLGREVWLETCRVCHTSDIAGAPLVTDRIAWAPRLEKGMDVLYEHAITGFHGPMGTEMPPRGGNAKLSDEQVRAAVDYMVALVQRGS
jgi:cytochrome c5